MTQPIGTTPCLTLMAMLLAAPVMAADLTVTMHKTTAEGTGEALGTITVAASPAGAVFKLDLHGLPPGPHGFHLHENASCGPTMKNDAAVPAGAAGGHFDPAHSGKHEGPAGEGHLGDLPVLDVAASGTATQTLAAPRIKDLTTLKNHALIIHAGADNYSDQPSPLGGGGARFACGTIE
jgi:Cu-Zn family superoxide dismutase